jgi:hypothetical protein
MRQNISNIGYPIRDAKKHGCHEIEEKNPEHQLGAWKWNKQYPMLLE